jgi:hypothetical protein
MTGGVFAESIDSIVDPVGDGQKSAAEILEDLEQDGIAVF